MSTAATYASFELAANAVYEVLAHRLEDVPALASKDMKLYTIAQSAVQDVLNYTGQDLLPTALLYATADVAMFKNNRNGAEGLSSEGFAYGGNQSYTADIPDDIKRSLRRYRRLPRG